MNTIQIANLFVEGYCVILCLVIHLYMVLAKHVMDNRARKYFYRLLMSNILLIAGDSAEWFFTGNQSTIVARLMMIGITVYYFAAGMITYFTIRYIEEVVSDAVTIPTIYRKIGLALCVTQFIVSIINYFTGFLYYVDDRHYYVYRHVVLATSLTTIGYIVCFYMILRYCRGLKKRIVATLSLLVVLPAMASLFQLVFDSIAFVTPFYTMSLVATFLFIQAENNIELEKRERENALVKNQLLEEYNQNQERLITQIIASLSYSVEAKDQYTNGHSIRVANYVREIVYRMGYDEQHQTEAYYIGLLHDIGKIRIPDEIINKKDKLTNEEYAIIKLHPVSGYHILKEITAMPQLAIGARWHHERYDGSGYPNGLKGENIPLIARIVAVADAYDAMTSNRSYRKIMPREKVREEIEKGKGTQFDPAIADIMLQMIDEDIDYDMKQAKDNRRQSILVIDDDEMMHKFFTRALVGERYLVTCAGSAAEAKELMLEEDFDLCLLDVQMPEVDGFAMYDWIKEHKNRQKIIFISGNKEAIQIKKAMELDISDYLTKPVMVSVLKETVQNVLRHK